MSIISTKLLGFLPASLGAAALAAGAFAGLQTHRLHSAERSVGVLQTSLGRAEKAFHTVVTVANERGEALKARDGIIAQQSGSIDAIRARSERDRATYVAGILQADMGAKAHEARAAELVRVPVQVPDDRCEAARSLIIQELQNVR